MPGCPNTEMPGCPDARMPGCPDARMPGYPDARSRFGHGLGPFMASVRFSQKIPQLKTLNPEILIPSSLLKFIKAVSLPAKQIG